MSVSLLQKADKMAALITMSLLIVVILFDVSNALENTSDIIQAADINISNNEFNNSTDQKFNGPCDVHVYVFNRDDDYLKVSLFIDSILKDANDVSSDSEKMFNIYPLPAGSHDFKITWWDEDTKSSYEAEEIKEIQGETPINLYTSKHEEPEKYDIKVKLVNENQKDLTADLYVDDNLEKSIDIDKDSTSDFGTQDLEEGSHNLSVRWQDKDTKIQYEKRKQITVYKDDTVTFYAPEGVSFEAKKSVPEPEVPRAYSVDEMSASSSNEDVTSAYNQSDPSTNTIGNTSNSFSSGISAVSSENSGTPQAYSDSSAESSTYTIGKEIKTAKAIDDGYGLYVYLALVGLAVYLIFGRSHA
ncbi:MAG: hypothetical protein ACE14P_01370 [Methanotrichaceae archaeon]